MVKTKYLSTRSYLTMRRVMEKVAKKRRETNSLQVLLKSIVKSRNLKYNNPKLQISHLDRSQEAIR